MRKLILEEWVSLDGYAEDRNGKLDFFPSTEQNKYSDQHQLEFLSTVDLILLGRKTYQLFEQFWPTAKTETEIIAEKLNSIPKIVFSDTISRAPWGTWPEAKVVPGNAAEAIGKMKKLEGKNMVLWGSISLAQSLMKESVIDEFHIQFCPTRVGGGRLLFPDSDHYNKLKLVDSRTYDTGVVYLNYQPE
jgi:dihydrofolate reductase